MPSNKGGILMDPIEVFAIIGFGNSDCGGSIG